MPNSDGSTTLWVNGALLKAWLSNGKWYAFCPKCGAWVCLNKTFFGSLHICR